MIRFQLVFVLSSVSLFSFSQNDLDAIRYSLPGFGGSSRFISTGGAFGAVGADLTAAAYNPAGLAIFRKGELSFSAGFRATNNVGDIYKHSGSIFDLNVVFNNFGIAAAWKTSNDPDSRHVIAFTNTQLQNFNNSVRMTGYTNSSSIAKDMVNLAEQYKSAGDNITNNLSESYEGLGFNTYLLDTANGKFYSFVDLKRSVKQTRDIVTSGRVNDLNFSYAYAYKDKFYLGASIGIPQIKYESTTTHVEEDDRDSMRVIINSDSSYSTTYIDGLPAVYYSKLGFRSLEYTEYFKTTGGGINLKLGGIVRVNDLLRVGFYYHTPTLYRLEDSYYNNMRAAFDKNPNDPVELKVPEEGGYYKYRIITPGRVSLNAAFIIDKLAVIGLDYEIVNYRNARLASDNISDFEGVNSAIKTKYKAGHNVRVGGELNLNPIMVRLGYNMQGSPFGDVFSGSFVRNTFSAGAGFRTKNNFYFDFVVYRTVSREYYYPFSTMNTKATLYYNSTTFSATAGIKF